MPDALVLEVLSTNARALLIASTSSANDAANLHSPGLQVCDGSSADLCPLQPGLRSYTTGNVVSRTSSLKTLPWS
eukprot:6475465-Amphidinium_carterae.2